jgi:hypothetical protein
MRLIAVMIAFTILLTACIGGGDDVATPEALAGSPTTEAATQPPSSPDPTATESVAPSPSATPAPQQPEPTPTASPTAGTEAPAVTPTTEDVAENGDLELLIQEVAEQTAAIRGLPLLEDIDSEIIDREQLRENLLVLLDEYGQEQADLDRDVLWMLRLFPDRDLDYFALQIDLYTEQVAGYYDSDTGQLFVIGEPGGLTADQKVTLSHEIVHALQDQHFGLDLYDEDDPDFDRFTAFQSLYEGDATWTMIQWAISHLSMEEIGEFLAAGDDTDTSTFDNAPRYVRESLIFPYNAGFAFVEALIAEGGIEAVDAAMQDPPVSTEQIIHPEAYINQPRDLPLEVDVPELDGALGEDWDEVYEGSLGVFDLVILLEENGVANGTSAASGWGGAWFVTYQSGDDLLSVLSTRWDSDADAVEFDEALKQTMASSQQDGDIWFDGERYHHIATTGDSVVLTSATNRDALLTALEAMQVPMT